MVNNDKRYTALHLQDRTPEGTKLTTADKMQQWSDKQLHGRHINNLKQEHIDLRASNGWLTRGDLTTAWEAHQQPQARTYRSASV
ncbi:hypothetical protein QE152_g5112 [Popillia japonica]|uniref:Uncharacterized protein n=1 Tax=Popillia japonica TaxID=7064 RepID=A0AAW1MPW5_POPJA